MIELTQKRTKSVKAFDLGNGQRLYRCHVGNIHYPDSSKIWQDIDTVLKSQASGRYQDKCFYNCAIPDKANGVFEFFNRDHYFNLRLVGVSSVGCKPIPGSRWGDLGKGFQYTDAFGSGIHFEVIAKNMRFDKRIRFDKPPPNPNKDFVIDFEILSKPDTFMVQNNLSSASVAIDLEKSNAQAIKLTNKIISLRPSLGKHTSYIFKPFCNDSNGKHFHVGILFYKESGRYYLRKIIPKEIFRDAVYPIFADDPASYAVGAGDGPIESDTSYETWDAAHDNVGVDGWAGPVYSYFESGCVTSGGNFKIVRSFFPVDTSGIADGDTVTAAILYLYGTGVDNGDNDGEDWMSIVQTSQNDTSTLISADFDQCGDSIGYAPSGPYPTEGIDSGARIDLGSWNAAGWNSFTFNATGHGWVDKTGYTKLGLREGHDCLDHSILSSKNNRAKGYTSERTGTSEDPYLDVTSSAGGRTTRNTRAYPLGFNLGMGHRL